MALRAIILGAAAGGGLPQWNCNGPNSRSFWQNSQNKTTSLSPATQSSIAVSLNGSDWAILNASPDIRSQIMSIRALQPRDPETYGLRDTPIRSVLITNGDVDHIAGLLTLREKQKFHLFATNEIHNILIENPIFQVLDPDFVIRSEVQLNQTFSLLDGLDVTLFAVPGKVPLFLENQEEPVQTGLVGEQTVGVEIGHEGKKFFYIPGCAHIPNELGQRLKGADLVLFDGTLWQDDEMIQQGVGQKTGARMGHMSMSGNDGSMAAFEALDVKRKIYVHINNTNPVWMKSSKERFEAESKGWEISYDGMEITL